MAEDPGAATMTGSWYIMVLSEADLVIGHHVGLNSVISGQKHDARLSFTYDEDSEYAL
jgi:hypothetical protein